MTANHLQEKLSSWEPQGDGRHQASFVDGGWTAHISAEKNDTIAGRYWDVTLVRTAAAPQRSLRAWAEGVAKSVSGLKENLKVIEIDDGRDEALLRSQSPTRKGAVASYYELVLTGQTKATLKRYQADTKAGTPREPIPFAVTHEVLAELVEDIAA